MKKKRPWRFAVLALALAGSVASVHAEELTSEKNWTARFTGDKIESNFSNTELAEEISGLQPGDSITINVAVENGANQAASFYLTNEVLSSLEDSRDSAAGGAYGYRLNYQGPGAGAGGTDLYNSDTVGGENTDSGEGLHKAATGLGEYIYLDSLEPGQKGNVSLTVSLDGETQGNGYQNTFADLQLRFAAELADTNGGGNNGNGNGGGNGGGNGQNGGNGANGGNGTNGAANTGNRTAGSGSNLYTQDRVYTGDADRIMVWSAVALVSGLGLLIYAVVFYRKEKRRERP